MATRNRNHELSLEHFISPQNEDGKPKQIALKV
jgi:hypothetical protein